MKSRGTEEPSPDDRRTKSESKQGQECGTGSEGEGDQGGGGGSEGAGGRRRGHHPHKKGEPNVTPTPAPSESPFIFDGVTNRYYRRGEEYDALLASRRPAVRSIKIPLEAWMIRYEYQETDALPSIPIRIGPCIHSNVLRFDCNFTSHILCYTTRDTLHFNLFDIPPEDFPETSEELLPEASDMVPSSGTPDTLFFSYVVSHETLPLVMTIVDNFLRIFDWTGDDQTVSISSLTLEFSYRDIWDAKWSMGDMAAVIQNRWLIFLKNDERVQFRKLKLRSFVARSLAWKDCHTLFLGSIDGYLATMDEKTDIITVREEPISHRRGGILQMKVLGSDLLLSTSKNEFFRLDMETDAVLMEYNMFTGGSLARSFEVTKSLVVNIGEDGFLTFWDPSRPTPTCFTDQQARCTDRPRMVRLEDGNHAGFFLSHGDLYPFYLNM